MSAAPEIDVARLVDDIREEISRRRAAGDLTAEDVEWLIDERLKASIAKASIDDVLAKRLQHDSHDWNVDTGYEIRTKRPGLFGSLVRAAKSLVRPFVRLYTDHILNRQAQINLAVWHILIDSVDRATALEMEVRKVGKEVDDLKGRG